MMSVYPRRTFDALFFLHVVLIQFVLANSSLAQEPPKIKQIPPLEETLRIVGERQSLLPNPGNADLRESGLGSLAEAEYQATQYYYQIQSKGDQLSVAKEVKKHFEKAVTKAEEKYDDPESDADISQSDITKLKLGLAGALNDIVELESGIDLALLSLETLMGWELSTEMGMAEESIKPVSFSYTSWAEYRSKAGSEPLPKGPPLKFGAQDPKKMPFPMKTKNSAAAPSRKNEPLVFQKAFIHINKAREKMNLANKTKKITRALLVTEVANYDFGLGNSEDLFQALIIYTRVLKGYYKSIYSFNMAVADFRKAASLKLEK
ncbi:MAG: hypothetical protein ACE5GQ_02670 [Nitrospinales bacterium]